MERRREEKKEKGERKKVIRDWVEKEHGKRHIRSRTNGLEKNN